MVLTAAQERLVRLVFEGELVYREIEARIAALNALPSKTPEETAALARYELTNSEARTTVLAWYNRLRAQGVTRAEIVGNTGLRTLVLDWMKAREESEKAAIESLFADALASWLASNPNASDSEKAEHRAALDADKAERLGHRARRLALIEGLRTGGLAWSL